MRQGSSLPPNSLPRSYLVTTAPRMSRECGPCSGPSKADSERLGGPAPLSEPSQPDLHGLERRELVGAGLDQDEPREVVGVPVAAAVLEQQAGSVRHRSTEPRTTVTLDDRNAHRRKAYLLTATI